MLARIENHTTHEMKSILIVIKELIQIYETQNNAILTIQMKWKKSEIINLNLQKHINEMSIEHTKVIKLNL